MTREVTTDTINGPVPVTRESLPAHIRDALAGVRPMPADPGRRRAWATPDPRDVAREVREERRARVAAAWVAGVPDVYAEASLATLDRRQDPGGLVSGWARGDAKNLVLLGPQGSGKTFAAFAVARAAADAGRRPLFADATELGRASLTDREQVVARMTAADVLVVDDFGRERWTEWTAETFYAVVNARSRRRGARTVWTTNLPLDWAGFPWAPGTADRPVVPNITERYGASVADRLADQAVQVIIAGPSRRRPAC